MRNKFSWKQLFTVFRSGTLMLVAACWMSFNASQTVAQVQWLSSGNDFYQDGSNWVGGVAPTATQGAVFTESTTNAVVFWSESTGNTVTASIEVLNDNFIFAGNPSSPSLPFTHTTTGSVLIRDSGHLLVGTTFITGAGPMILNAGSNLVTTNGDADLTVQAGSVVDISDSLLIADTNSTTSNNATIIEGSIVNVGNDVDLGNAGAQTVTVNVSGAGSLLEQTGAGFFRVGNGNAAGTVNVGSGGRINTGTGDLIFTGNDVVNVNSGGTFEADGNANITDGRLTLNGGTMRFNGNVNIDGGTYEALSGNFSTVSNADINVSNNGLYSSNVGLLINSNIVTNLTSGGRVDTTDFQMGGGTSGVVNVDGGGADVSSTLSIFNNGTLNLNSGDINTTSFTRDAGGTFNHTAGTLVIDGGTFNPNAAFYRTGTFGAATGTQAANVTLQNGAVANFSDSIQVRSNDTLRVESGSTVNATTAAQIWGDESRSFAVVDGAGSVLSADNNLGVGISSLAGRLTVLNGGVARAGSLLFIDPEGQASGNGTLEASTVRNNGVLDPNNTETYFASSRATLNIDGNFEQTSTGDYAVDVTANDHDLLSISGNATLGGTLSIFAGALPSGIELEILDIGGTRTGQFDGLAEGATVGNFGGTDLMITYAGGDGNDVVLYTSLLGDCDFSGEVNFLDISPFITILASGNFLFEADCNQDGFVNFLDIAPFIAILSGS